MRDARVGRAGREEGMGTLFVESFGERVVRVVGEGPAEAGRHRGAFHGGEYTAVCVCV